LIFIKKIPKNNGNWKYPYTKFPIKYNPLQAMRVKYTIYI